MRTISIFTLLIFSILMSCTNDEDIRSKPLSENEIEDIKADMIYTKDHRTGLCFSLIKAHIAGYNDVSHTCVPCDSVKKYINMK